MEKLIIWGTESVISEYIGDVNGYVSAGDIMVLGICFTDHVPQGSAAENSFPLIACGDPEWETADCVLVCSEDYSDKVIKETLSAGAAREKLIFCKLIRMEGFSFDRYMNLAQSRVTILSNCCWGGLTYHYFKLFFLSPTINLFITDDDYIRLLENLDTMLEEEPVFDFMEYSQDEDFYYPVFDLSGVKLHMNHCHDREQGLNDWKKRCARVRNNMLITMITEAPETARRFDALPFKRKICFVSFRTELASCVFADPGKVPFVSFVNSFASGTRKYYDPWVLLEEGRILYTVKDTDQLCSISAEEAETVLDRAETILIYGAQAMGIRAYNMLKAISGNKLSGFAVTSMKGNPSIKNGYPVMTIVNWRKIYRDKKLLSDRTVVFLALHPDYYDDVRRTLRENGFHSIITFEELELIYNHKYKASESVKTQ